MHRSLSSAQTRPDLVKSLPFFIIHLLPLGLFWTGARAIDWAVCFGLYVVRMFFITGVYHRYFAHRGYKMGRVMQFLMAFGGTTAAQKGPLWWAGHHREHHKYSDMVQDAHSPKDGFWWSHVGWIISNHYDDTAWHRMKDFAKYPELRLLNRFHLVPPILLGFAVWAVGGWSMLLCGFFLSTVLLYHGTFSINSLAHVIGKRRYVTTDTSKNSFLLALITLGEGWHNNHHYYQSTANQGFYWWEVDISYYVIKALSWVGLTYDLRTPPKHILDGNRVTHHEDVGMLPDDVMQTRLEMQARLAAKAQAAMVVETPLSSAPPPAVAL
jgi:stearoyl-CoA desaturase (Delta-9 desaturase)